MPTVIRLILQYSLIGITTAIGAIFNPPAPSVPTPYIDPYENLPFLFATEAPAPNPPPVQEIVPEIKPAPAIKEKTIEKPKKIPLPEKDPTPSNIPADGVVNIFCTEIKETAQGTETKNTTGSGVIISKKGLILTNAHVAYVLLQKDLGVNISCSARLGHIAGDSYFVDLAFIPMSWLRNNPNILRTGGGTHDGKDDIALLIITTPTNIKLRTPDSFPYVEIEKNSPKKKDSVFAIGYPAEHLPFFTTLTALYRTSDETTIIETYSFGETVTDIFTTDYNETAEQGSSGGAIINKEGRLVGIIVSVSGGRINALSIPYIESIFLNEDENLNDYFKISPEEAKNYFHNHLRSRASTILRKAISS